MDNIMTNMSKPHTDALPPISNLVMHAKPMLLIDRAITANETSMTVEVDISGNSMFCVPDKGVPGYVGIEYIAQTVAAYSGWRAKKANPDAIPRVGYLLGSRKVTLSREWFPLHHTLSVYVSNVFEDGEMGVFDGEIRLGEEILVAARINVYQPKDNETSLTSPSDNNQETEAP
jgi:predicted hotdog family 3-hydroxylacyl-ACP dehydratase